MKVRELLSKLSPFDPELDVVCYCEDPGTSSPGSGFRLFEINEISVTDAEKTRLEDGTPYLKLGKSEAARPHVLIDVTADF